jgi:ubiquinone biosynthesis protein
MNVKFIVQRNGTFSSMLDQLFLPSPLIHQSEKKKIRTEQVSQPGQFFGLVSLYYLIRFIVMLIGFVFKPIPRTEKAKYVKEYLESRGGVWIKVGQLLATRRDLIPSEYCDELERLQDRVSGFSPEQAIHILESELGRSVSSLFFEFIEHPVAAASISQIHRARLRNTDNWVAVKILRPNIEKIFKRDLALLKSIVWILEKLAIYPYMRWSQMYDELNTMLHEEVDLRIEAGSIYRMRKTLRLHENIYVPRVFLQYCTEKVMVMEWIDGIMMTDFIAMNNTNPGYVEDWCEENEIEPHKIAETIFFTVQRQIYEDNFFHGDLHPGNIMLLRKNRISLIDFGSVGTLDSDFLKRLRLYNEFLGAGQISKAMTVMVAMSAPLPPIDVDEVVQKLVRHFLRATKITMSPAFNYQEKAQHDLVGQQSEIMKEYKIPACWDFLRISRTTGALEITLRNLDPEINYSLLTLRYLEQLRQRENQLFSNEIQNDITNLFMNIRDLNSRMVEEMISKNGKQDYIRIQSYTTINELLRILKHGTWIATFFAGLIFVAQNPISILPSLIQDWLIGMFDFFPNISNIGWLLIALFLYYCHSSLRRISNLYR